jgi:RHS repeat-associated protein
MATDHQGTTTVILPAVNQAAAIKRTTPFGAQRGQVSGVWPSSMDKGLVGGTVDNTGLTHLGAREYDPSIGRFVSVDPIMDQRDPQSLQSYAYANNTPITMSDPTGQLVFDEKPGPINWGQRNAQDHTQRHNRARDWAMGIIIVMVFLMGGDPTQVKKEVVVPGASKNNTGRSGKPDIIYIDTKNNTVWVWEVKKGTVGAAEAAKDIAYYTPYLKEEYPDMDIKPGFPLAFGPVAIPSPHRGEFLKVYNGGAPGAILYDVIEDEPPARPTEPKTVPARLPEPVKVPVTDPVKVGVPNPEHGPCGGGLACPVTSPVPGFLPNVPSVGLTLVWVAAGALIIAICLGTAGVGCGVAIGAGTLGGASAELATS